MCFCELVHNIPHETERTGVNNLQNQTKRQNSAHQYTEAAIRGSIFHLKKDTNAGITRWYLTGRRSALRWVVAWRWLQTSGVVRLVHGDPRSCGY